MTDIQSAAADIRRGKKEEERKNNKPQHENIMVCFIPYGDHNKKYKTRILRMSQHIES